MLQGVLDATPPSDGKAAYNTRHHVLAVSGGADSVALLHAVAINAFRLGALGHCFHVVTVDHALRPEAAEEAISVGQLACHLGLPHRIQRWEGKKPTGNLQASARQARYDLLAAAAEDIGAASVITAHHEDDQIETHLLAAARSAGPRGLAGMRARRALRPGLRLLRPFLSVPGARLQATTREAGLPVIDDPSNLDPRYDRVRLRRLLSAQPVDRAALLARIAGHQSARDALDGALGDLLAQLSSKDALRVFGDGAVRIDAAALDLADRGLRIELLARLVEAVGGQEHAPLRSQLDSLDAFLQNSEARSGGMTLGGVAIRPGAQHFFFREFGRIGPTELPVPEGCRRFRYDGRLSVDLSALPLAQGERRIAPLAALGLGNARERTLPVLLGSVGRPIAAAAEILHKLPAFVMPLDMHEEVSWRVSRDLTASEKGR